MLGKLLKYEFWSMGRILIPIYGILLLMGALFGVSAGTSSSSLNIGNLALGILYGGAGIAMVVMTLILIIQRFYKNLLGNEGYLMFCLPVTTGRHITNKIISATVWIIIGAAVGFFSAYIILITSGASPGLRIDIGGLFEALRQMDGASRAKISVLGAEMAALLIAACAGSVAKIYASIAIGHQWSNHRIAGAVLTYAGLTVIEVICTRIADDIDAFGFIFGYDKANSLNINTLSDVQTAVGITLAAAVIILVIYWFITWILLDRKLNLE